MSGCDVEGLEALAAGLDGGSWSRDAETRAHVAGCPRCAGELARLRAERRLFGARAAIPVAAPPPFAAVLATVRRERRSRWGHTWARWGRPPYSRWQGFAAAAALAAAFVARRGPAAPAAPAVIAEPPPTFACYDDPRSLAVEATAYATDRAVASAEDTFAACLVATPRAEPGLCAPASGAEGACALPAESDVTCSGLRPLDDEIFESRIRGGTLQ